MTDVRTVHALGDRAVVVETHDVRAAHALAAELRGDVGTRSAPAGVEEIVVGFANVAVVLDPEPDLVDQQEVARWLVAAADRPAPRAPLVGRDHQLPVVFDGPDLDEVADDLHTDVGTVVDLLVGAALEVAFVGFTPGFAYLTGLPAALAALPRRATPRTAVPAGSVAVAGGFAGIYPQSTPGGWHLLGRTTASLFAPDAVPPGRLAPGDRVRLVPAGPGAAPTVPAAVARPGLPVSDGPHLEVLHPGLATSIQDRGRRGVAHLGVPRGGTADPRSALLVNLLLGDDPQTALLECTATGPTVRVGGDGHLAVVGAGPVEITVDGHPVADRTVVPVSDGQVVRVGRVDGGLRAYLGVAGGIETPLVFGSRSSDTLSGLGVGLLRTGDVLARGAPGRVRGWLDPPHPAPTGPTVLRVVPGPDGSTAGLTATTWRVSGATDRVGVRFAPTRGPGLGLAPPRASIPVVTGAVQVPPDGRPIALLPDHATVGGYPVVACVATVDLPLLGQLAPGDEVTFTVVDLGGAAERLRSDRSTTRARVSGWYPTASGT